MKSISNPKLILLGGGLANGLIALHLLSRGFRDFLIIERETRLGGEHTWSFHTTDVDQKTYDLLRPMLLASWNDQEVIFSKYNRVLKTGYNTMTSDTFHDHLFDIIPADNLILNSEARIESATVTVDNKVYTPDIIIDGRGVSSSFYKPCGYQKFYGLDVVIDAPHGLTRPIIMDANVVQKGGVRFIYSLPFSERRILVEDTRYSLTDDINENECRHEVEAYINNKYGEIKEIKRVEKFALPIPLESKPQAFHFNVVSSGLRGGLFQPVTGFSVPLAAKFARLIGENVNRESDDLLNELRLFIRKWEKDSAFYHMLNKMMFGAAEDDRRVDIFKRFYKLNHSLIERFYRGDLNYADRARLLIGKPPVPIGDAFKTITDSKWLDELR